MKQAFTLPASDTAVACECRWVRGKQCQGLDDIVKARGLTLGGCGLGNRVWEVWKQVSASCEICWQTQHPLWRHYLR